MATTETEYEAIRLLDQRMTNLERNMNDKLIALDNKLNTLTSSFDKFSGYSEGVNQAKGDTTKLIVPTIVSIVSSLIAIALAFALFISNHIIPAK